MTLMTIVILVILVVNLAWTFLLWHKFSRSNAKAIQSEWRLKRLEHQVDTLLQHLDIKESEDSGLELVKELVRSGMKVEAIRRFRQQTGAGLAEAKRRVEALEKEIR
ncbi:MAG: hypothetical protein HC769_09450 [Cyanobacteria bacterium CRU_2_1]|nr:hypothetical protein [Cyanobacteria bacterium RU_5_0]NJR59050.1 hypothetical protein [Cyanobacteria bacterium CRU_2_1]